MIHTITLTDDEETFLNSILATKIITNGVVPTIDQVLTTQVQNKIAELKRKTDKYTYAEQVKSRWDGLTDTQRTQIKDIVKVQVEEADIKEAL